MIARMISRRQLLVAGGTAGTASLLAPALRASSGAPAAVAGPPIADAELKRQLTAKLTAELGDATVAGALAAHLFEVGCSWTPPSVPATRVQRIVAYAFGNRPNGTGSGDGTDPAMRPAPGPMNEALADVAYELYGKTTAPIYAQWEIAHVLKAKYKVSDLISIEPVTAADGSIRYLSTDGVAQAIVAHEGNDAAALGVVAVIAHRDHAKRCVQTSRARGMDAYVPEGVALPDEYDAQSGQPWTRRREVYLIHDMLAQLAVLRADLTSS